MTLHAIHTPTPRQPASNAPIIGLIGIGTMGGQMAQRLINAGYPLHLWARRPEQLTPFTTQGATAHATPQSLACGVDILLLNVTQTADVLGLLLGQDAQPGLASHLPAGSLVIDFSTIDAATSRDLAAQLHALNIAMLDCPVSGGVTAAQAGTLSMMAGGTTEAFERALPVLEHLGKTIVHVGPSGSGQVVKAANQMVMCATLVGIAEAMTYAKHFGADLPKLVQVLSGGFAGSKVLDWVGPRMAGTEDSVLVQARLHEKDLRMVAQAAQVEGLHLPVIARVAEHLSTLIAEGGGYEDTSQVLRIVERASRLAT